MKEMTCGECVHFEGGGRLVKKFWLYCPFKMTGTEASSVGCGEGTRKPKEKYDGWTIKVSWRTNPCLLRSFIRRTRSEVIQAFEKEWKENWKRRRKRGDFKIVKVKLVEISD